MAQPCMAQPCVAQPGMAVVRRRRAEEMMLHQSAGAEAGGAKSRAAMQENLGSARGI